MCKNHKDTRNIRLKPASGDSIKVPSNWKDVEGVIALDKETNSALANRDYNITCDLASTPIAIVEGYFIWWCKVHHQPEYKCELDIMKINSIKI